MRYIIYSLAILFIFTSCGDESPIPNPTLPILVIEDLEIEEGNTDQIISYSVRLEGQISTNVVVEYTILEKTASRLDDYEGSQGQLVFAEGETEKTIEFLIVGDILEENNESFEILLLNPINATFNKNRATVTILNDDDGSLIIPTEGYVTPTSYSGYSLVWSDEFDQSVLNEDNWTHEIGNGNSGWGNNELQYYKADNTYFVLDDYMIIEARQELESGFNYTSSRIVSQGKQEFKYGRIDIRAATPRGRGLWPALWMLGKNFNTSGWPSCGEIDIMEVIGHQTNIVHGTVHYGADFSQHDFTGASRITPSGNTFDSAFHVFSLIWEEDLIQILVDDVLYVEIDPSDLNGQPWPFNNEFFFIMNVAVGGNWPGNPDINTVFPQRMIVDYVRVFQ